MAASSRAGSPQAFPEPGTHPALVRNPVGERLRLAKREAIEEAMGKGESWATKIINGEAGVRLDDLPQLLAALGLKVVSEDRRCVDPDIYEAVMLIHERLAPNIRKLVWDDSE